MYKKQKGFTLIELLIVVSIIAVLAVIGAVVYSNFQRNARDARRVSDINAISTSLENNYNSTGATKYPAMATTFFASGAIPLDPLNGNATACNTTVCKYCVRSAIGACVAADATVGAAQPPAGNSFVVCTNLENATGGPGGAAYFCKQNQQ